MSAAAVSGTNPYIAALRAGDLFADPAYQRDLDISRVERMRRELDRTLLGVIEVSERAEGRYAIIDGQHRWAVIQAAGGEDAHLVCQVHTGLGIEDEARLFYEIDTRRKTLSWWDRWRARRGAGDPQVLGIDQVLRRHRLQVNPAPADGNVRATKALQTIVTDLGDLGMLDQVLSVLSAAFGRSFDAFDGALLQGVALVLGHYPADELDTERLARQLRDIPPRQLRAKALALREAHRGTVPRLCAAVIVERYNAGRGRNIEAFFTRAPSTGKGRAARQRGKPDGDEPREPTDRNGDDVIASRTVAPAVRRAREEAQVAAAASGTDPFDQDESPTVGVPDLAGVQRALRNGRGLRWVMDAYGLDYMTAKTIRDQLPADRRPGTAA
jgi:hypothetical protein